jgi:hypothetical protein
MSEKNDNLKKYYTNYLALYIQELTNDKDVFYISICDIEYEIIDLLRDLKLDGIQVDLVNKTDYSIAVGHRNDTTINKIVVLTPDSIKKIDSLKDFNEYPIFPEIDENSQNEYFWRIIKKVFLIDKEFDSKVEKFINLIIKEKRINLSQLFELIENSVENGDISVRKLNNNLNIVNCWRSDGTSQINITVLRKLIRLSDPAEIEKRISVMSQEGLSPKQIKDFNDISKLSFANNYDELFKRFFYEDLPKDFTNKPVTRRKIKNDDDDNDIYESTKQYKFSYEAYLEETQSIPICKYEENMPESLLDQFNYTIEKFEDEFRKININDITNSIQDIINEIKNGINIRIKTRTVLIQRLEQFKEEIISTYMYINEEKKYPHMLDSFCHCTEKYLRTYIALLSFIVTDEGTLESIGKNKIVEEIQCLFVTKDETKIIMSFMHPISVFYFNCINNKFKEISSAYQEYDINSIHILLNGIFTVNTTRFPINILISDNKLYSITENFQNEFTYFEFIEKTQLSSESILDIRTIVGLIEKYITYFPYKSEIIISILGNPSFKNIGSLKKIIDIILNEGKSIIRKLRIDVISESHEAISNEVDDLYKNESIDNKIQFRLLNFKSDSESKTILNEAIDKSDMVFLFDCVFNKKEELKKVVNNYNSSYNEILMVCSNENIERIAIVDFPIENLWATLHNMLLNGENYLSYWVINELDNTIINLIKTKIEGYNELMVCLLTSNLSIINKIYMTDRFSSNIIKSKGKDLLALTFGTYIKTKNPNHCASKFSCVCSLKNILQSILDDQEIEEFIKNMQYEPKEILENLILEFNYDGVRIKAICYYPKDENESFNVEEYQSIWKFILNYAFRKSNSHSKLLKSVIVTYLYMSVRSYGDALLVNHIERYLKLDVKTDVSFNEQSSDFEISYDINTTNVRNMLSYLENYNSVDERFKTVFKSNYEIDELKKIRAQANFIQLIDNNLINKIDFILKEN